MKKLGSGILVDFVSFTCGYCQRVDQGKPDLEKYPCIRSDTLPGLMHGLALVQNSRRLL